LEKRRFWAHPAKRLSPPAQPEGHVAGNLTPTAKIMMDKESPKLESKKEFELSYEPFDPEAELKNLRYGDKETRAERLKKYKEELIKQKEGIAEIQEDLEKQIRENPDLNQEELMKTVLAKAPEYRLSENQLDLFKKTLNKYVIRHQAVREARKKYPYNQELFKACFGKEPEGGIEIIELPASLHWRCHGLRDYAWIKQQKFSLPPDQQKLTRTDLKLADSSGGCLVLSCLMPSLSNAITVENAEKKPIESPRAQAVLQHEEQHSIYRLFKEQLIRGSVNQLFKNPLTQKLLIEELSRNQKPDFLLACLRSEREHIFNKVKDEILAYYKGIRPLEYIKEMLLRPSMEGGSYDYFYHAKDYLENALKERLTPEIFKKNKKNIEKILCQVFIEEYADEIIKAINSINKLEKLGKSQKEIIYLLITEPLSRWDKLVQRMKEIKSPKSKV